jgi:type IV secretion system protein VirD4
MDRPTWLKAILGLIVFSVASIGVVWLAGFLFLALSKVNPVGQTDLSTWWTCWQWSHLDPILAKRLTLSAIVAAVIVYGAPVVAIVAVLRDVRSLHGEARFAHLSEIQKAGLLGSTGLLIGKIKNKFLLFPGLQFVLLAAPTRSGKGVGIVIPNLLHWSESVEIDLSATFLLLTEARAETAGDVLNQT